MNRYLLQPKDTFGFRKIKQTIPLYGLNTVQYICIYKKMLTQTHTPIYIERETDREKERHTQTHTYTHTHTHTHICVCVSVCV